MSITTLPATGARFEDVRTVIGPRREGSHGCWCLAYLVGHDAESRLRGEVRADRVAALCRRRAHAPGVLAYADGEVVGWAGVLPWAEIHEFAHGRRYPRLDTDGLWGLWCLRVRAGHSGHGVATALIGGAVDYARSKQARAVVAFPMDNRGAKVDRILASVGVRAMFDRAGFRKVGDVDGRRDGMTQVAMRLDL